MMFALTALRVLGTLFFSLYSALKAINSVRRAVAMVF